MVENLKLDRRRRRWLRKSKFIQI